MHQLPEAAVSAWVPDGPRSHPTVVDWICPSCTRAVSFTAQSWRHLEGPNWYSQAHCPRCKSVVQVFTLNVGTGYNSLCGGKLFMFPAGKERTPTQAILDSRELGDPLKRAYESAVTVLNTKQWSATAVMCRRLLEGIATTVLPVELHRQPLGKQLEAFPVHRSLDKPLVELADAVRRGGNLGAHFRLEREPDERVATLMLDLCEDLMEYLFTLPDRINELHKNIEALGKLP